MGNLKAFDENVVITETDPKSPSAVPSSFTPSHGLMAFLPQRLNGVRIVSTLVVSRKLTPWIALGAADRRKPNK
jgi:hypothetical protein